MTPAERAVIDAARAFVECSLSDRLPPIGCSPWAALRDAVRALPRPLSEQLADLRPGDLVETLVNGYNYRWNVLANFPERGAVCVDSAAHDFPRVISHHEIRRIISNPEADRG